jgi:hypothetical protein
MIKLVGQLLKIGIYNYETFDINSSHYLFPRHFSRKIKIMIFPDGLSMPETDLNMEFLNSMLMW